MYSEYLFWNKYNAIYELEWRLTY